MLGQSLDKTTAEVVSLTENNNSSWGQLCPCTLSGPGLYLPPSRVRTAETFLPGLNSGTNVDEAESMWFTSLSAVFSQADPVGCSLLISTSVTTTDAAEMLKGRL